MTTEPILTPDEKWAAAAQGFYGTLGALAALFLVAAAVYCLAFTCWSIGYLIDHAITRATRRKRERREAEASTP